METLIVNKPRLAFCGLGWIGRNRMQSAANSGLADIVLLADTSEECINEARKIISFSGSGSSLDDIVNNNEVDAVVIATPSAFHKDQAVKAFQNNKAVFCQKPLGRSAEEVEEVLKASRKANRLLGADFSYRHTEAFRSIRPFIQSGELGKIFTIDLKFHNAYGPDKPWFYDINLSGGGCVLDLGIHLIDLMLYALDFPDVQGVTSQLYSKGVSCKGKKTVEDFASVQIELANDITAQLSCSWNLPAGCDAVIEASFYGTTGGVSLKNVNGSFFDFKAERFWGTKTETIFELPDDWGGRALIHWIEQLSIDPSYDDAAENYLLSAQIADQIYGK